MTAAGFGRSAFSLVISLGSLLLTVLITSQVVYSTDCTFTVLSLAQNYTRFLLKLVSTQRMRPAMLHSARRWLQS